VDDIVAAATGELLLVSRCLISYCCFLVFLLTAAYLLAAALTATRASRQWRKEIASTMEKEVASTTKEIASTTEKEIASTTEKEIASTAEKEITTVDDAAVDETAAYSLTAASQCFY